MTVKRVYVQPGQVMEQHGSRSDAATFQILDKRVSRVTFVLDVPPVSKSRRLVMSWRWPEVVLARPERRTGRCDQSHDSHREFPLEHQYGYPKNWPVRQEMEDERGRDLVGGVGDADVRAGVLPPRYLQ